VRSLLAVLRPCWRSFRFASLREIVIRRADLRLDPEHEQFAPHEFSAQFRAYILMID
jgi:hypothetical protein